MKGCGYGNLNIKSVGCVDSLSVLQQLGDAFDLYCCKVKIVGLHLSSFPPVVRQEALDSDAG